MSTKIFDLRDLDMASAYDWSQCEAIRHGDVMLVADGVAIMCEAWPTMVAGASSVFHRVADGVTWERFALDCPRPGMAAQLLAGVAVAGRPVSRVLDGLGWLEVLRVATDGCPNACSALYGACARIGKEMGYLRHEIITYTLPDEPGTSLLAAGWVRGIITDGKSWDRPSRRRSDNAPTCRKQRWRAAAVPSGATS